MLDRNLATPDLPLLNRLAKNGETYISESNRTIEDDEAIIFDAASSIRKRTHISELRFDQIFHATMRYFTEIEKYKYKSYQSGELKKEEFYKECGKYLVQNYEEMKNQFDFNVMMERIVLAVFQYDVLQPLIDNPETSDIKICGPDDIRVRVKGKAYKSNAMFLNAADLYRFIDGLAIRNHVDIFSHPLITFTDKHDENYILRFTISSPTVTAVDYPYLHIRKVSKHKPSFDDLIKAGMLTPDIKTYLIDRAKLSKGIVFAGPPGCVDKNTEFFNGKEWKSIADYIDGEQVLQYDTETGEASLTVPDEYIKKPCNMMYHFETKYGLDQTLSPEHRVLYYNKTHKNGKKIWSNVPNIISAEELAKKQNSGHFYGGFKTSFKYNGNGIDLLDAEIKLMLAVICDGTFDNRGKTDNRCTINIKKDRKKKELENILEKWGHSYTQKDYKNGYTRYTFCAPRKEKEFTSYWYNCSQKQLQLICDNVLFWDGHIDKNGRKEFTSGNINSINFIQFAFSACGYRAVINNDNRKGQTYKTNGKNYIRRNNYYNVLISDNTIVGMAWHNDGRNNNVKLKEVVPEDGMKYCFTVPKDTLVLRRNGKIFITKNSGKTTALNAWIEYIPKTRETLVIQENDELYTEQSGFMFKHVTHGFHDEKPCTLEDLGKMALVEGCNEFIIGEVKGGEMRNAMTLINAGGHAALTVHSTNAYETLDKMADLVKYGSTYTFEEARRMLKTFDTIVYLEGYKVREILECEGYDDESGRYIYRNIYKYGI